MIIKNISIFIDMSFEQQYTEELMWEGNILVNEQGYLEGLKFGLLITFILFLLNLIITKNIKIRLIILYIIINITSILGSMFGILKSKMFDK